MIKPVYTLHDDDNDDDDDDNKKRQHANKRALGLAPHN